jgi:hypothetical protein
VQRLITSHNAKGKGVFPNEMEEDASFDLSRAVKAPIQFFVGCATHAFQPPLINDDDLNTYKATLANPSELGLSKNGGSILGCVGYPP